MRFYDQQHEFYCGVDLHTRRMYLCILDREGNKQLHRNMRAKPHEFLRAISGFREDLVVGVECMFTWYWLADLCTDENIHFVLGHALYMKAIHGGKKKNDKIDSEKIARLMRGGTVPLSYVYGRTLTRPGAWINVYSRVHGGESKKPENNRDEERTLS